MKTTVYINKELIKKLQQLPDNATITIETPSSYEQCNTIQYNEISNEIILSHFDKNVNDFVNPIDILNFTAEEEEICRSCGIW